MTGDGTDPTASGGSSRAPSHAERVVAVHLVRGALALAFGLAVLLLGSGLTQLSTFLALYAIGSGAVTLQWARHHAERGRWPAVAIGLVWLSTGTAILLRGWLEPLVGEPALLDFFGIIAVGTGIIRVVGWYRDDALAGARPRPRYRYVMGPLDIWLGLTVLLADDHTSQQVRVALGLWGLAAAAFLILDGLAVRRAGATSRASPT